MPVTNTFTPHEQLQIDAIESVLSARDLGQDPAPIVVEVHPTDLCNHRCSYCFHGGVGNDATRRNEMLSVDQYSDLFDEAEEMGVQEISVSGGGEPFLYKGIDRLLSNLGSRTMRTRLITHGNQIPEEVDQYLLDIDELRFSIDTTNQQEYNRIRGLHEDNPAVSKTLANMRRIVDVRESATDPRLQINATAILGRINSNPESVQKTANYLLGSLGIDRLVYKQDIYGIIKPDDSQIAELQEVLNSLTNIYGDALVIRTNEELTRITGNPCIVPYFKIALNPYGEVFSCCLASQPDDPNGELFGSLEANNGSFRSLWESSKHSRDKLLEGVKCTDCNHTDRTINARIMGLRGEIIQTTQVFIKDKSKRD